MDTKDFIQQAAEKVGGIMELGRRLGIRHNAFYRWKKVPAERVLDLERISGIPRQKLRPDLYPE